MLWLMWSCAGTQAPAPTDPPLEPPDTGPQDTGAPDDTDDTDDTDTSDTGSGVTQGGFPVVTPPTVDCTTLAPGGPQRLPAGWTPTPFDTRSDGLFWFADRGVFEGADPPSAVKVWDLGGELVREDPYGNVVWTDPPDLWRVPPGGAPQLVTSDLEPFPRVAQDLDLHPHGSAILAELEVGPGTSRVTYIDPAGTVTSTDTSGLTVLPINAVAWAHDWRTLWLVTATELWSAPVDPDGAPDLGQLTLVSTLPLPVPFAQASDVAVDACGGVYIVATTYFSYGSGGVTRYDPADGTFTGLGGIVDHGYGGAPLRFGRAPGEQTHLVTMSGGWSTIALDWMWWDVGVGAPAWP